MMGATQFPESAYDKAGDYYFELVHQGDPSKDDHIAPTLAMLGDVEGLRVCDLACGEGFFSRLLAQRGAHATGVDLSANLLGHARRLSAGLPIEFVRGDVGDPACLEGRSFDAVVCNMALMDIDDLTAALRTAHRVLRRGGTFVFSIVHPCFNTPYDSQRHVHFETDAAGNFVATRVTNYGAEGKWNSGSASIRGTLGAVHRKLSTYVNALREIGFAIEELAEPMLPPGDYATYGEQKKSQMAVYLVAKTIKVAPGG